MVDTRENMTISSEKHEIILHSSLFLHSLAIVVVVQKQPTKFGTNRYFPAETNSILIGNRGVKSVEPFGIGVCKFVMFQTISWLPGENTKVGSRMDKTSSAGTVI